MMRHAQKTISYFLLMLLWLTPGSFAQESAKPEAVQTPIQVSTDLVLVNVVARDKKGNLVRDLKQQDFTVLEDGQKQQVSSFDFENIDELALAQQAMATANGTAATAAPKPVQRAADARDEVMVLVVGAHFADVGSGAKVNAHPAGKGSRFRDHGDNRRQVQFGGVGIVLDHGLAPR